MTCRFINADGEISGIGVEVQGYNQFAYCLNNPVNMDDQTGNWPKWVAGALNIVSGALQIAAGAVIGAAAGWTGVGALAAGVLVVNGSSTIAQGVGQVINSVTKSNVLCEENLVRKGVQEVGRIIGGDTGAKVTGFIYDAAVTASSFYTPTVAAKQALQQAGVISVKVPLSKVVNNPADEFVTSGPAPGVISEYCRSIPLQGYGKIYATQLPNGLYQLVNGHHRVAALRSLGEEVIRIFLTP